MFYSMGHPLIRLICGLLTKSWPKIDQGTNNSTMKTTTKSIALLLLGITLNLATLPAVNPAPPDYTTMNLPEGAIARLGKGWVRDVAYSPKGDIIAVATSIGVWLYDAQTHKEIALLTGHSADVTSVAFSPDGQTIASGGDDNTLKLWSVAQRREIASLTGHSSYVTSVAFSSDGQTLASGSEDGTILVWDLVHFGITSEPPQSSRPETRDRQK